MRHRKSGRKLGRNSSHRSALFNNLVTSLLTYGRIETTEAKAKELRGFADSTITLGRSRSTTLIAKGDKATPAERAQVVHAKRMARQTVKTREALDRLFAEIGPHFATRKGGYTRHAQDPRPQGRRGADGARRARRAHGPQPFA